mmetsp:Transcript_30883/g.90265  ORF Transcript_30883/g.90265 Transcript_30883/m.90265 type:complete len:359 (-) Transcript_30883:1347-2423(-)
MLHLSKGLWRSGRHARRRQNAFTAAASSGSTKPKMAWLDLSGSGVSAMERLVIEEALLRHDPMQRSWGIVGNHDPTHHMRLSLHGATQGDQYTTPDVIHNSNCVIIMGIGGKTEKLLDMDLIKEDAVQIIRRFSGGGTVVMDHSSLWTTFIGRDKDTPDVTPYPREIMKWTADEIFSPTFQQMKESMLTQGYKKKTLVMEQKSCGFASEQGGSMMQRSMDAKTIGDIPDFALVETDYVLGDKKIGGNAQAITKDGWLHHTSFLWDYIDEHMRYLTLPEKRPDYRGDRSHDDFLVKLCDYFGRIEGGKRTFFKEVRNATAEKFELEEYSLKDALGLIDSELGGIQEFYDGKCRSKVVEL